MESEQIKKIELLNSLTPVKQSERGRGEKKEFIDETHPAITAPPEGSFALEEFRRRLLKEGYDETNIIAAMLMRVRWLESQEDSPEELKRSALTLRILEIHALNDRALGIKQGIRAALQNPDFFKKLV